MNGETALMYAISRKLPEVAKKILKKPTINVKLKDNKENTTLEYANQLHQTEIADKISKKKTEVDNV